MLKLFPWLLQSNTVRRARHPGSYSRHLAYKSPAASDWEAAEQRADLRRCSSLSGSAARLCSRELWKASSQHSGMRNSSSRSQMQKIRCLHEIMINRAWFDEDETRTQVHVEGLCTLWLGWILRSVLVVDWDDFVSLSPKIRHFLRLNLISTHLFICWSCNDSSIVSKLSLYFSLPNRSVMSSAQTYAYIHLHSFFSFFFPNSVIRFADSTHLASASSDSWDTASWSPLSPLHCALLAVEKGASHQATQPPAALEDKSPSRGRWWGGRLLPPTTWERSIPARD